MSTKIFLAGATAIALLSGVAFAQDAPNANQNANAPAPTTMSAQQYPATPDQIQPGDVTDPQDFANQAAIANMFEIQSSQVALQKSQNQDVKDFAQKMVDDHSKASDDMKTAASAQGVTLPTDLDKQHSDDLAQLNSASADQFDQLYVQMQTQGHQQAVALFKGYSQNGPDGVLKDFAGKLEPTLEQHYKMVMDLRGKLNMS